MAPRPSPWLSLWVFEIYLGNRTRESMCSSLSVPSQELTKQPIRFRGLSSFTLDCHRFFWRIIQREFLGSIKGLSEDFFGSMKRLCALGIFHKQRRHYVVCKPANPSIWMVEGHVFDPQPCHTPIVGNSPGAAIEKVVIGAALHQGYGVLTRASPDLHSKNMGPLTLKE